MHFTLEFFEASHLINLLFLPDQWRNMGKFIKKLGSCQGLCGVTLLSGAKPTLRGRMPGNMQNFFAKGAFSYVFFRQKRRKLHVVEL